MNVATLRGSLSGYPRDNCVTCLQLRNITIKPLLFHSIGKKISLRNFVCAVISLRTYVWICIQVLVKPALGLAVDVSLVKAIVKLGI